MKVIYTIRIFKIMDQLHIFFCNADDAGLRTVCSPCFWHNFGHFYVFAKIMWYNMRKIWSALWLFWLKAVYIFLWTDGFLLFLWLLVTKYAEVVKWVLPWFPEGHAALPSSVLLPYCDNNKVFDISDFDLVHLQVGWPQQDVHVALSVCPQSLWVMAKLFPRQQN